ncbi:MAG: PadR family transcriptional regulator [Thermoleophilaceae bacterium]|nr:PadR family transcriptional regulator [Thermoleophilaceae bacterium]
MSTPRLTPTSYVVLGLVERCQPATPYDIKQVAELSTANFWSVPHTQLYTECARMAEAGLLDEDREDGGRRRRTYRLTVAGRAALEQWSSEPAEELYEHRDLGVLKLFLGGDPAALAEAQLALHEAKLAEFEETARLEMPAGMRLALESGIGHEKEFIRFWKRFGDKG